MVWIPNPDAVERANERTTVLFFQPCQKIPRKQARTHDKNADCSSLKNLSIFVCGQNTQTADRTTVGFCIRVLRKVMEACTAAYQLGISDYRTITEIRQRWVLLVLGWETVQNDVQVLLSTRERIRWPCNQSLPGSQVRKMLSWLW